ncbi:hypothetical protein MRB53_037702 [Persea americana]|nr:hypothetical protein MRB53_037702 [Persea americana]
MNAMPCHEKIKARGFDFEKNVAILGKLDMELAFRSHDINKTTISISIARYSLRYHANLLIVDYNMRQNFYKQHKMDKMLEARASHRDSKPASGAAILATFIPTFITACVYVAIFFGIRNSYRKIYAPRTFLGTVAEKHRTPEIRSNGSKWLQDFRKLPDRYVLQHNSIDTYLFLRFFKLVIFVCCVGCCLIWPILLPVNVNAGGDAKELDRLSFSNVDNNSMLWAHTVVAWVFFIFVFVVLVYERLRLIGIRQAHYLNEPHTLKLSSRTVLFTNVSHDALLPENLEKIFGSEAERSWPIRNAGDLEDLIEARKSAVLSLESAEVDLITRVAKRGKNTNSHDVENGHRPVTRNPPLLGQKSDKIEECRAEVVELTSKIDRHRQAPSRTYPEVAGVFVAFKNQLSAHRAYQQIKFKIPAVPFAERYLDVQPKEVLWKNLDMPLSVRLSKSTIALVFVIVFTIFFAIPVGLIGTLSNASYLAKEYKFLAWINDLPPAALGLLTGLLPPFLISEFTSYVPKLFRHIAKLSGEPTTRQAELLVQAWYFAFQVFQIFLVTTFSSGAAAVVASIAQDPGSAPALLAESLPKASNFYLTYITLQATSGAADTLLNYSDLFEYLFYIRFWDKTPRQKFQDYSQMKGFVWAKLLPKFTNMFVIALAYSVIAPLVLGFATVGFCTFYLAYRYNCLYVYQTKIDSHGEAYNRALQQSMTGLYLAELCLIGLFGARGAGAQTTLMIILLVLTAVGNLVLDRMLHPLETLLGIDDWTEQEVPLLAQEDDISPENEAALHIASHNRRLGLQRVPRPLADRLSAMFDSIITPARKQTRSWLEAPSMRYDADGEHELSEDELKSAYVNPAFTAKTPKAWIPRDPAGEVSKEEVKLNVDAGIPSTDEGASIDKHGTLHWETDFEKDQVSLVPSAHNVADDLTVPHGGYVASTFQQVAKLHFETTLKKQNQPHNIILHFEYVRRTEVGPALFKIKDLKIGRGTSTVQITLSQKDREEVFAIATNSNLHTEQGVSLQTCWQLNPPRPSVNISKLDSDTDENYGERRLWTMRNFRKAPGNTRFFFPRAGQAHPSIVDQWICMKNGENWTNTSLGYVADAFPQVVEVYAHQPVDVYSIALEKSMSVEEQEKTYKNPGYWFPTLVLNLDIKKALPEEGVKWLGVRLQAKQIKNGRFDLEIIIMDESGEIVALSHHSCMIVSAARNLSARSNAEKSKI